MEAKKKKKDVAASDWSGETERGSTSHRYYLCSPGFGTYRRLSFCFGVLPVGLENNLSSLSPIHASMQSAVHIAGHVEAILCEEPEQHNNTKRPQEISGTLT